MRYDANDDQALFIMITWHYQKVITIAITWGRYIVMRFLLLDAQTLSAKERHFILPLVITTFIMQSVTFITPKGANGRR